MKGRRRLVHQTTSKWMWSFPKPNSRVIPWSSRYKPELASAAMPFPSTPENPEVSKPTPLIEPNSYKDIKDSLYFQERMVKTKKTKKLTKKEKEELQAGKQPRQLIQATPLRKTGISNKAARNEVNNTISAGQKSSTQECSSDWGCEETPQVQTRDCGSS